MFFWVLILVLFYLQKGSANLNHIILFSFFFNLIHHFQLFLLKDTIIRQKLQIAVYYTVYTVPTILFTILIRKLKFLSSLFVNKRINKIKKETTCLYSRERMHCLSKASENLQFTLLNKPHTNLYLL